MVTEPIRGNSLLDIIFTTAPASYKTCRSEAPVLSSDHCLVVCQLVFPLRYGQPSLRRPCRRSDYDALQAHLAAFNWAKFLQATVDINVLWGMFHSIVSEAVETCSSSTLRRATYVSRRQRSLLMRKKRRWRLMKAHPSMRNKDRYRLAADQLTAATRMYRTRSENALLRSSHSRFYRYVSSCLAVRDSNIVLTSANGQLIYDYSSICEELSADFSKNFSQSSGPSAVAISPSVNSAFQVDLSLTTLLRVIQDLPNSAAGPDNIPAAVYKRCAAMLARPLLHLFQQSLYGGTVPAAWKVAKVCPLYKGKGKRSSASSYRPISLTSVASKILERLFVKGLSCYMDDNNRLNSEQHGFRCGRSTVINLLSFDKHIVEFLNNGSVCDVIMIDFCRAFD